MTTFSTLVRVQSFPLRPLQLCCWVIALLTVALARPLLAVSTDEANLQVSQLLADAAQAEVKGDVAKSAELMREALRVDPDNQHARWQSGQIQVDKQWVTVDAAQKRAAADPLQSEYRERRAATGANSADQLALAKWCRKKGLNDEAFYHWVSVLATDPTNEDALRALDLRWQNGQLMNTDQIADYKAQLRAAKQAADRWKPKIAKWRQAVSGVDDAARREALGEIRAITDLTSIESMEQVTLGRESREKRHADECVLVTFAYLDALAKMPAQPATESLARHAVFAFDNSARVRALEQLKKRDMHDYVPMLLDALSMPIESNFSVQADGAGNVHYTHSLYREGASSDWSTDANRYTLQELLTGGRYRYYLRRKILEKDVASQVQDANRIRVVAQQNQVAYRRDASAIESRVAATNQSSAELNARIIPVLVAVTGKQFDTPRQWWDYWRDSNEYYQDDRPVNYRYYSDTDKRTYGAAYDTVTYNPSCFVKGTLVWTKTGRRPIESIEFGDLVLSQDVNTGELKYSPVIGRTIRPPSPVIKLTADGQVIRTTRGHLFWVAGTGWRMAKELEKGSRLHGLGGGSEITAVEPDGEAEAYNLVVADLGTYFVGDRGLLVHDNTPRVPTRAIVPGILAVK